jgi:hypothetical protein
VLIQGSEFRVWQAVTDLPGYQDTVASPYPSTEPIRRLIGPHAPKIFALPTDRPPEAHVPVEASESLWGSSGRVWEGHIVHHVLR